MKTVLVTLPVNDTHKAILEKAGAGCAISYLDPKELTKELVASADVIIGPVDPALICASEKLGLLQLFSAGADPYIVPGVLSDKTWLANATGAYGKAVSEHALALTLMMLKKLHLYRDEQRQNAWRDRGTVRSLTDCCVVVVGLGNIGLSYARLVKALGAKKVIGVKRRAGDCPEGVDELCLTSEIERVLPEADVLVSFLPGNRETFHFYTAERFALMKRDTLFVNCGRGAAVAKEVLLDVLQNGVIGCAACDVTELEPLPGDSPLWQLENLMITPHVAGYLHLPEILDRIVDIAAENLARFLRGEEPLTLVDRKTGYKR